MVYGLMLLRRSINRNGRKRLTLTRCHFLISRKCGTMASVTDVQATTLLQWRDRLDERSNKIFSSNHKIVTYRIHCIFVQRTSNERGYFLVFIGKLPKKSNLVGQTGLSDWTIRAVINDLCLNMFLKRIFSPGTAEENYQDTKPYLKP